MKKLHRISKGEYYINGVPYANSTLYINHIDGMWLVNIDHGMTIGVHKTLKEAKEEWI